MAQTLAAAQEPSTWADWEAISCPVLVLRASRGIIDPRATRDMKSRLPAAEVIELADARHDLHLDRPTEWRHALSAFL